MFNAKRFDNINITFVLGFAVPVATELFSSGKMLKSSVSQAVEVCKPEIAADSTEQNSKGPTVTRVIFSVIQNQGPICN